MWGRRQKYVDEQMEKRMGVKKDDPSQARGGPMDPEQQLYITPDELKVWALASWLCSCNPWCLPCMRFSATHTLGLPACRA